MDDKLTVAEIAQHARIAPSHVRYYQRAGLLPVPARVERHVLYPAAVLERLRAIATAREAGAVLGGDPGAVGVARATARRPTAVARR